MGSESYYDTVITGIGVGGVFTCRKNLEPQHPGDTIHAVTQFPQRGKTPSQSGFSCVNTSVNRGGFCQRILLTQLPDSDPFRQRELCQQLCQRGVDTTHL